MELLEDFPGPTNLDACLVATVTADVVRRRSPRKNKAAPVRSTDILSAVSNLDSSSMLSGRDPLPNPREYMSQQPGQGKSQALSSARSSAGQTGKSSGGAGRAGGGSRVGTDSSLSTGRSEYDTLGSISSFQSKRSTSQHPLNHHSKRLGLGYSHAGGGVGVGGASSPSRSVASSVASSSAVSTVPPRSECTHLEEEQYQMMLEIDR